MKILGEFENGGETILAVGFFLASACGVNY